MEMKKSSVRFVEAIFWGGAVLLLVMYGAWIFSGG